MATAELVERRALEDIDRSIMTFQQTMEEAAQTGALDAEQLGRFSATFKAAAARINERVLPQIDPDAAAEMSQRLIAILTLDPAAYGALDAADQYLIDLEAIRHVLRDLLQEQPLQGVRKEPREVIALLEDWLPDATVVELADLLGVSVRQLQRRRHDGGVASSREQLVAKLVGILRYAWTDAGVLAWFHRARSDLSDKTPAELLDEPAHEQELLSAARAGRVQGGI